MNDDEPMTEAAIDAEFERTQGIGNALHALAQAELAVASVDEMPRRVQERLDQVLRGILGQVGDW